MKSLARLLEPKRPAPNTRMFAEAAEAAGVVRAQIGANGAALRRARRARLRVSRRERW